MEPHITSKHIEELRDEALKELDRLNTLEDLDGWRVSYLGRRGRLTNILRGIGDLPPEQRQAAGSLGNRTKSLLEERLEHRTQALKDMELGRLAERGVLTSPCRGDPSRPGGSIPPPKSPEKYATPSLPWASRLWKAPK